MRAIIEIQNEGQTFEQVEKTLMGAGIAHNVAHIEKTDSTLIVTYNKASKRVKSALKRSYGDMIKGRQFYNVTDNNSFLNLLASKVNATLEYKAATFDGCEENELVIVIDYDDEAELKTIYKSFK